MAPGSQSNSLGICEWCVRCKALLPPRAVCVSPPCPLCVSAAGGPVPDCPGAPPGHQVSEGSHGRAPPAAQEHPAGREGGHSEALWCAQHPAADLPALPALLPAPARAFHCPGL
ncbi:hypothetical protein Nmel_017406 [Mimus melanotis]